jgi:hypothetical protein
MNSLQRYTCKATIIGLCLAAASGAYAQVGTPPINSAIIFPTWNDVPLATRTYVNSYPAIISLSEANVSGTGYANRDLWQFSNNGVTAYQFQNTDYFNASFNVTLSGGSGTYYPEAGWLFSTANVGDIQSIVATSGTVAQFGGISYNNFNPPLVYTAGETFTLGLNYCVDPLTGNNSLQFSASDGVTTVYSPVTDFAPGAGIGNGSVLGGYFQIPQNPNNPTNSGVAVFSDITIVPCPVPEPSVFALLGLGIVTLGGVVSRRRRI